MLVVRGPTYFGVRSFIGLFVVVLPLLLLLLRTAVALRTIRDPSLCVFLARRELRNLREAIAFVRALWFFVYYAFLLGAPRFNHQFSSLGSTVPSSNASIHLPLLLICLLLRTT